MKLQAQHVKEIVKHETNKRSLIFKTSCPTIGLNEDNDAHQ
jgi:hypothetical protein